MHPEYPMYSDVFNAIRESSAGRRGSLAPKHEDGPRLVGYVGHYFGYPALFPDGRFNRPPDPIISEMNSSALHAAGCRNSVGSL
jgi:hypothetical protein